MARKIELTPLKKGKAEFNLIGKAKIGDFTFKMNCESQKSDWIYNSLNLGVECGENGVIYAESMGGYGSERENKLFVHGKKSDENGKEIDDFDNKFTIDWDDRKDEDILKEVGDMSFFEVGLETTEDGKVVKKRFLSEYDFIEYIQENLEDGMNVNVKGNLVYSIYNDTVQMKRKITSIFLSSLEKDKHKATFTQTLLLEEGAVGKIDRETLLIPITAKVVDYVKEYEGKLAKRNLPLTKVFNIKASKEKLESIKKLLKHFDAKKKTVTKLTVVGYFTKGSVQTVETTESDIPDDIMELIELGYMDKEEVLGKMAYKNGGGKVPEMTLIQAPAMKFVQNGEQQIPTIDKEEKAYTEDDLDISLILEDVEEIKNEEENEENDDLDINLDDDNGIDDDDDNSWLDEL